MSVRRKERRHLLHTLYHKDDVLHYEQAVQDTETGKTRAKGGKLLQETRQRISLFIFLLTLKKFGNLAKIS